MMNNLSAELDVMRPSMLESGLETIAYNVNRRNTNLQLFEFGKIYLVDGEGFKEEEHFCIFATGNIAEQGWRNKTTPIDFYAMKGLATAVLQWCGLQNISLEESAETTDTVSIYANKQLLGTLQMVGKNKLNQFDLKQPVFMLDLPFSNLVKAVQKIKVVYKEVNKFPAVQRDLALVVNKQTRYEQIEKAVQGLKINKLQQMNLFDVFESDKLGADKKSMAVNFTFSDDTKTLTDNEIDAMMNKLIKCFEKEINAEIRK
jgi:phenylalanyl-tRNA synthetase beta chain